MYLQQHNISLPEFHINDGTNSYVWLCICSINEESKLKKLINANFKVFKVSEVII